MFAIFSDRKQNNSFLLSLLMLCRKLAQFLGMIVLSNTIKFLSCVASLDCTVQELKPFILHKLASDIQAESKHLRKMCTSLCKNICFCVHVYMSGVFIMS